ncbi:hypothetical protein jhhlp_008568 [Lomentospora prolificans]|uniref:UV-damage endonuclease n=1 Tax=Lomentospora prolificans TaxID=41688 RepID=A0A2N3MYF1_9PEZI|nr:hypothetical protein jhhlp_008568 [Lomentospora prolificans]
MSPPSTRVRSQSTILKSEQQTTRRISARLSSRAQNTVGDTSRKARADASSESPRSSGTAHIEDHLSTNPQHSKGTETQGLPVPDTLRTADGNAITIDYQLESEAGATGQELQAALGRPPPVNSGYLPLPWKGRLGYACLNTYLRTSNPPVFSSRTCRIATILEHRYPLTDPTQPEHATKNRPDRNQPASVERGQKYVEAIGLVNARDIKKMVRWNERYGIKFMRLSSEMFPFASHEEYGYKLAPFASETLAEAGKVIAQLGHRVTTHPGQFTQLGSPRKAVVDNAIRDLEYHDEMLSLLRLPDQMDKDAVIILHMGGVFGDKLATLERFKNNYAKLTPSIRKRLVLENDDVSWGVHDLLPICQDLNIPLVLDYHHHNIVFDDTKVREGTLDIMNLYDEISETWKRKGITQKMHYSEPTAAAITGSQRRKHAARVMTLPPCSPTMDLMIEAKDKEQAVFELMRTFKLPGFDTFNNIVPHQRDDEAIQVKKTAKGKNKKKTVTSGEEQDGPVDQGQSAVVISDKDTGMGGPHGRVYWPPGMEAWLKPLRRTVKKNETEAEEPSTTRSATRMTKRKRVNSPLHGGGDFDGLQVDGVQNGATPRQESNFASRKRTARGRARATRHGPEAAEVEGDDLTELQVEEEGIPVSKRARLPRSRKVDGLFGPDPEDV